MNIYKNFKNYLRSLHPSYYRKLNSNKVYVKYVISGGTAAFVDLALLYVLTDIAKIHYLLSASMAFVIAFFVSFCLQKFWTFRDNDCKKIYRQMSLYFMVGITNLGINIVGMYVLVDKLDVMYILAQIITGAFLAIGSFLIYRYFIFKKRKIKLRDGRDDRMRILIATGIFPPDMGGPATYVKTLCEELPKLGCEVKVVTYAGKDTRYKIQDTNKFEIINVNREQNILLRYIKYFWQVFKLGGQADVVYVQGPVSEGLPSWLACKLRRKKYALKIVGDYAWEQGIQRFGVKELLDDFQSKRYGWQVEIMRKIQKLVARGADKIITPSKYLKKVIQQWGINENKIQVIYNSVKNIHLDINKESAKQELNLTGDIILSSGRLVPWKGFSCLIELMPALLKINKSFQLIIIGDGPELRNLKLEIRNLELKNYVFVIESVEQEKFWQYMRAADMFVLNTGYEGLPHMIIEAMKIGVPVVATNAGGNIEVVENNKNGLLVEYNNKEQIKNAILELWKNIEKAEKLKNEAKINLSKFNKEKMINRTVQILKQL